MLETIIRNDSTITLLKIKLELDKIDYNREEIFNLQNEKFPELEMTTVFGKKVNNETLFNKVTFINLWYINCAPCLEEIPILNELKKEYGKSVNIIGITFDNKSKVIEFLKRKAFDFDKIAGQKHFLKNNLKVESYPKILIVNKKGIVKLISNGIQDKSSEKNNLKHNKEFLREKINELILK